MVITPVIYMTRGLPASGKTTWAKRHLEAHPATAYVSKNAIRKRLGIRPGDFRREDEITAMEQAFITEALKLRRYLIVDNLHLSRKHFEHYIILAIRYGYNFHMVNLGNVPMEVCLERDALRPDDERVGSDVIRRLANQFFPRKSE